MEDRPIIGLTENVLLTKEGEQQEVIARIDTGATLSSIDLPLYEKFALDKPHRTKVVKSASGTSVRDVVHIEITLAGKKMVEEFSIADRSNMKFEVLIGQNILKEGFLIDPLK